MSSWRNAGVNYIEFSNIAANILRKSLKADEKEAAMRRGASTIRFFYWVNGQILPEGEKPKPTEKPETVTA